MSHAIQVGRENFSPGDGIAVRPSGVIGSYMLVLIGMMLLLVWIINYAVPLNAGSLIDLLLLFAAISFGLDYLRNRRSADRRRGWDQPPSVMRRKVTLAGRKVRGAFGDGKDAAKSEPSQQAS
jgi:hypothetical protein